MKSLIQKDLIATWKYCRAYLIVFLIFPAVRIFVEEFEYIEFYPVGFSGMLISTLIAYDERDKWDKLCLTLPLTRKQIVTSKYLTAAMIQLSVLMLTALLLALTQLLTGGIIWEDYFMELAMLLVLATLIPSLQLPFVFKMGSEKGRIAFMLTLLLITIIFGVGGTVFILLLEGKIRNSLLLWIVPLCALSGVGSWRLAIRWYEQREF